ncbi:MAG TPA: DUF4012 domain-containing protein [Aeromicrobium sp.]|nr:DUF4012 domain-containing protein [Aeromicrobium sp.]
MSNPLLPDQAKTAGRVFVRAAGVFLLLVLAAAVWVGVRGYLALGHLQSAQTLASTVSANPTDTAKVESQVAQIQEEMSAADSLTSDPVWRLGERVPYIGAQLSAVSQATSSLSQMSDQALTPLVDVAGSFSPDSLTPKNGKIDTAALTDVKTAAQTSGAAMTAAAIEIESIDRRGLLPPLADAVDELSEQVTDAAKAVDGVRRASILLPKFLGEDGARSYLVLGQNNAEWRSLGGMVGAMFVARTDDGRIELGDYYAETDLDEITKPVVDLPKNMRELFIPNPAKTPQNVTQIPDFAQSGEIASATWRERTGEKVDGVIAIDPVTLSYLLEATGPVEVPVGTTGQTVKVTSENAVSLLLNEIYLKYSVDDQDAIFNATTSAVFGKIIAGKADPRALLTALSKAAGERRILIWSDRDAEQAVLDGTNLQGALPRSDRSQTPFGVYLNDATGSKLSYYMDVETGADWCRIDGDTATTELRVKLTNNAPKNVAELPDSIIGGGYWGTKQGLTRNLAYIYLPKGSKVVRDDVSGDGPLRAFGRGTHEGREVLTWSSLLKPGQSVTATVRVSTGWTPNLTVVSTPTIPGSTTTVAPECR